MGRGDFFMADFADGLLDKFINAGAIEDVIKSA
jgi:hypothetical protein